MLRPVRVGAHANMGQMPGATPVQIAHQPLVCFVVQGRRLAHAARDSSR